MFLYLRKNSKFSLIGIFYGSVDRDTDLEERSLSDLVKKKKKKEFCFETNLRWFLTRYDIGQT